MKSYEVKGGLGRLSQFPKTVFVSAQNELTARAIASNEIRTLIALEDFDGNGKHPMLNKVINIESVREYDPDKEGF